VPPDEGFGSKTYSDCFSMARHVILSQGCEKVRPYNARVFDQLESLAARLLIHSVNEAVGAAVLGRVAKHHSGTPDSRNLARHARDEARHSKMLALASTTMLPGRVPPQAARACPRRRRNRRL
jgi:hypothetical protein